MNKQDENNFDENWSEIDQDQEKNKNTTNPDELDPGLNNSTPSDSSNPLSNNQETQLNTLADIGSYLDIYSFPSWRIAISGVDRQSTTQQITTEIHELLTEQNKISKQQLKLLQESGAPTDAHRLAYNSNIKQKSQTYEQNEKPSIKSNEYSSKVINEQNKTTITKTNNKEDTNRQNWESGIYNTNLFPPLSNQHMTRHILQKHLHQSIRETKNTYMNPRDKPSLIMLAHQKYLSNSPQIISKMSNDESRTPAEQSHNSVWAPLHVKSLISTFTANHSTSTNLRNKTFTKIPQQTNQAKPKYQTTLARKKRGRTTNTHTRKNAYFNRYTTLVNNNTITSKTKDKQIITYPIDKPNQYFHTPSNTTTPTAPKTKPRSNKRRLNQNPINENKSDYIESKPIKRSGDQRSTTSLRSTTTEKTDKPKSSVTHYTKSKNKRKTKRKKLNHQNKGQRNQTRTHYPSTVGAIPSELNTSTSSTSAINLPQAPDSLTQTPDTHDDTHTHTVRNDRQLISTHVLPPPHHSPLLVRVELGIG